MLGNYSKLFGAIVGGIVAWLVSNNLIPADFNTPDIVAGVTTVITAIFVYLFPANVKS